jgi:hypothetical protein
MEIRWVWEGRSGGRWRDAPEVGRRWETNEKEWDERRSDGDGMGWDGDGQGWHEMG